MYIHLLVHKRQLQAMKTSLSLSLSLFSDWKLWWCRNSLRYLKTLLTHFNIALTEVIICCTIFTDVARPLDTHAFTHMRNLTGSVGERIFMCTGELRRRLSDCSYRTNTDALWLVLLHGLHFPPPLPLFKFIHNKVRIAVRGRVWGGKRLYMSLFFNLLRLFS